MTYAAVAFRATGFERPLWSFPNGAAGRFNPARSWAVQYLSLHPMTPWAEMLRNLDLRTPQEARAMRFPLWAVRLELAVDPLNISFADAAAHGIAAEDLVDDDRSECHRLARMLRAAGISSFTAPSAALPGTENLVVLQPATVIDYHQTPIHAEDWPAAMTAQDGRPPEGLWELVHYIGVGSRHPALQAYLDGDELEFEQPPVTPSTLASR